MSYASGVMSTEDILKRNEIDTELVNRAKRLTKLMQTPEFKEFITEGFAVAELHRLIGQSVNFNETKDNRELFTVMSKAPSVLDAYFSEIIRAGNSAARTIDSNSKEIELRRMEGRV